MDALLSEGSSQEEILTVDMYSWVQKLIGTHDFGRHARSSGSSASRHEASSYGAMNNNLSHVIDEPVRVGIVPRTGLRDMRSTGGSTLSYEIVDVPSGSELVVYRRFERANRQETVAVLFAGHITLKLMGDRSVIKK